MSSNLIDNFGVVVKLDGAAFEPPLKLEVALEVGENSGVVAMEDSAKHRDAKA